MELRYLAELAALLAWHGPLLIGSGSRLTVAALQPYWAVSRFRLDAWGRSLKSFRDVSAPPSPSAGALGAVVEEILVGEVLTRVWTAIVAAHDRRHGEPEAEPLVRGIYVGHLEARARALSLLIHAPGVGVEQAVALNRLRRRAECWSDVLIGRLLASADVGEFAPDPLRAWDFAADLEKPSHAAETADWSLLVASLRVAFQNLATAAPNADLNQRIAAAILNCLPEDAFDTLGAPASLWQMRLFSPTADAQGLVADLFRLDRPLRRRLSGR